jgi:excisionase family DNA binding protein
MASEEQWITAREAAEKTGYALSTILWLLREGRIKAWRPGHEWLTTLDAVVEYKNRTRRGRPSKSDQNPT